MSKITIYSEAYNKVEGFKSMGEAFKRKLIINGKSKLRTRTFTKNCQNGNS